MTPDELTAAILQAASESEARSSSPYVDERQQQIRAWAEQLAAYVYPFAEHALSEDEATALAALQPDIDAIAADLATRIGAGMLRVAGIVRGRPQYKTVTAVTITNKPLAAVLVTDGTWAFDFEPTYSNATSSDPQLVPVWTSSASGVATINSSTGVATLVGAGSTTITVTLNGHSDTYSFTVASTPAVASSVVVTLNGVVGPTTVPANSPDLQLAAQVKDQFGADFTDTVTWGTSNASFATVNSSGLVNIIAAGTVNITAASDDDPTKIGTFQFVVTGATLTPTSVEIAGSATRSTTVGAGGTLTAIVKDQNGDTMLGLNPTWSSNAANVTINSTSGVWSAASEGSATITATYAAVDPDLTDTVAFTVGAAVGVGQKESPVGRPQFGWTATKNYLWDQMRINNHWWYLEHKANSNAGTLDLLGHHSAFLYQVEGSTTYLTRAYAKWVATAQLPLTMTPYTDPNTGYTYTSAETWLRSQGENTARRYMSWLIQVYDWIYPGLTADQRTYGCQCIAAWKDAILRIGVTVAYQGGWTSGDSDAATSIPLALIMLNYLDVPENKSGGTDCYLKVWNDGMHNYAPAGSLGAITIPCGGMTTDGFIAEPTGANDNTMRNFLYQIMTQGSIGGRWQEGSQYDSYTMNLLLTGIGFIRTSGNNGASRGSHDLSTAFPEFDAWLDSAAEKMWAQYMPGLLAVDVHGDCDDPPRGIDAVKEWGAIASLAGLAQGTTYGQRAQRLALDFEALYQSTLSGGTSHNTHGRSIILWNPYATADAALPNAAGFAWTFCGDETDKMYGVGYFIGKNTDRLISLKGGNRHLTDHGYDTWADTTIWRDSTWCVTTPHGYSTSLWKPSTMNSILLCGLGPMRYLRATAPVGRGVLRYLSGTAGGRAYGSVHHETHGPYYSPYTISKESYEQKDNPITFCNKAERRQTFLDMPNDIDVLVLHDDFDVTDPRTGNWTTLWKGQSVATTFTNHFALTGGCTKLLIYYAPTTPTYSTAGAHPVYSWVVGSYTVELHLVYWGSGGTTVASLGTSTTDAVTYTGTSNMSTAEYVGWKRINIWSNGTATDVEKYVTAWVVRPTAQATPAIALSGGDPNIITVGARTITHTTSSPYTAVT